MRKFGVSSGSPGFSVTAVSQKVIQVEDGSIGLTVLHLNGSGVIFVVSEARFAHSHEQDIAIFFSLKRLLH